MICCNMLFVSSLSGVNCLILKVNLEDIKKEEEIKIEDIPF